MPTIDALLGIGNLTDEERMRTMADSLRGQKRAADVFSLSTIAPIAQSARQESANIMGAAEQAGTLRQRALTRAAQAERDKLATRRFEQGQENWQATFDQREREAALDRELKADIAALKAIKDGTRKITRTELKEMRKAKDRYSEQSQVFDSYQPTYAGGGYGGRPLKNIMARFAPQQISKNDRDSAKWWSEYQRFHEAVLRHELFGAALTGTEKQNWKDMTISPNMTNEMIESRLARQRKFMDDRARTYIETQAASGMPDNMLNSAFGEFYPTLYGKPGTASDFVYDSGPESTLQDFDLTTVPEGVDPAEWEQTPDDEKQLYLENQ